MAATAGSRCLGDIALSQTRIAQGRSSLGKDVAHWLDATCGMGMVMAGSLTRLHGRAQQRAASSAARCCPTRNSCKSR